MRLLYFLLGVLVVILIWALHSWISRQKVRLNWLSWAGIIITSMLAFFTFAWSFSCILESEFQAAGMGLVFFGGAALIAFGLTRRKILRDRRNDKRPKATGRQKSES
jgi:hypothetical protein